MYVGRFVRNGDVKGDALMMSDFIFQRMEESEYTSQLEEHYKKVQRDTGKSYFEGQLDEAFETDAKGDPL